MAADEQVQVVVFAQTNLDTRIAFNTPLDITASAFKRDFERVHFTCLPNIGEIQVNGLMVKQKSCFYYLPDSLPLKYAFPGTRSTWFIHVEVRHLKNPCTSTKRNSREKLKVTGIVDDALQMGGLQQRK